MKKNKKKKAFTLIELLAVIVILAIIALIVTVSIGRLLDNAKKETFKESAIGVLRSAELYMGKYVLENKSEPTYPMVFTCNGVECTNGTDILDISGKVPKSGSITMVNHKTVTANYLSDGKYCVAGTRTDLQVANSCADIDVTKPTVSVEAEGLILKITMTDNESGIASYCVTTTNDSSTCNWVNTTDTYKEHEVTNGTWYVFAKDNKGNISNAIDGVLAERITFAEQILIDNSTILTNPTLTTTSAAVSENGLYSAEVTNGFGGADGTTYYFRGNVTNNYVNFAGKTWRIVRINEDGTVRLILDDSIDATDYKFNSNVNNYQYMYYSNSEIKSVLNTWYDNNIGNNNNYANKIASGAYFCEAAKVKEVQNYTSGSADMAIYSSYIPDYSCVTDGNTKGLLDSAYKIGLITYDEVIRAGGYNTQSNDNYYLYKDFNWWTMSSAATASSGARVWRIINNNANSIAGMMDEFFVNSSHRLRSVINLKADVTVTGTGISTDPYVVE